MKTSALTIFLLLVYFAAPAVIAAEDPAFAGARRQFEAGQFEEAAKQFRKLTQGENPTARTFLFLGLCESSLQRVEAAKEAFRQALLRDPTLELDRRRYKPDLVDTFSRLKGSLKGVLEVVVRPGKTKVKLFVDQQPISGLALSRSVVVGHHIIQIRKVGGKLLYRKAVVVEANQRRKLTIAVDDIYKPFVRRRRVWTWVGAATTVASLALAVGFSAAAQKSASDARSLLGGGLSGDEVVRHEDLRSATNRNRTIANVSWGITAGLAVVTAVSYWLEGRFNEHGK